MKVGGRAVEVSPLAALLSEENGQPRGQRASEGLVGAAGEDELPPLVAIGWPKQWTA